MMMILMLSISALLISTWKSILIILSLILIFSTFMLFNNFSFSIQSSLFSLDLMTTMLISLSILISILMFLASINIKKSGAFSPLTITLLLFLMISFSSNNLILFYIFFEAVIIPTLFIILLWGAQPERLSAGLYLIFYTLSASLPFLVALMVLSSKEKTLSLTLLNFIQPKIFPSWTFFLLFAFLVKLPMFLTHLWLPKAHVEAPVAGSMILAAVLLKLGSYGILRISNIFYFTMKMISPLLISISLLGGVLTSVLCLMQTDMKSLIAYSSVCHMSLLLCGSMTFSEWGLKGALSMMISHALCSSALFSLVTMMYNRTHTRSILLTHGILSIIPSFSMWWFILSVNNMAAPPSMNLISEISLMISILSWSTLAILPIMLISFLSATYSLLLFSIPSHGSYWENNSFNQILPKDHLITFLHWFPLNFLIIKMDLMMTWI